MPAYTTFPRLYDCPLCQDCGWQDGPPQQVDGREITTVTPCICKGRARAEQANQHAWVE